MSNKNLFKEAIADAKAVREAALANAKAALEEALTPRLQSMLSAKLNEMEYENENEMEEGFTTSHGDDSDENLDFNLEETDELEEDFDLSEILAELNEAEEKEKKKEEDEEEETEELDPEDPKFAKKLKALIQDLISQEMGNEGGAEMHAEPDADNMGGPSDHDADNADEEIDLEELLAELDKMGNDGEDLEEIDIKGGLKKIGGAIKRFGQEYGGITPKDCKQRALAAGKEGSAEYSAEINKCREEKGLTKTVGSSGGGLGGSSSGGFGESKELREAVSVINTLRRELNEVNLLNAKLLYVNKIFKAKNLSESQKLKVIASFDKATTAREAKVVFESLNSTLTTSAPKQAIKESLGFASRAAGVAPRKAIVESNDVIARMQKLANIIK
jgi:hypothetical protein